MQRLNTRGDTIVEVLLAIAVLGAVVGAAFVSANRSLNATQMAKERDQGVRLAESQLERLKQIGNQVFDDDLDQFCIDENVGTHEISGSIPNDLDATIDPSVYTEFCTMDSSNEQFDSGSESIPYYVSVRRSGDNEPLFTVRVRWERVGGGGNEEVRLVYRKYYDANAE